MTRANGSDKRSLSGRLWQLQSIKTEQMPKLIEHAAGYLSRIHNETYIDIRINPEDKCKLDLTHCAGLMLVAADYVPPGCVFFVIYDSDMEGNA